MEKQHQHDGKGCIEKASIIKNITADGDHIECMEQQRAHNKSASFIDIFALIKPIDTTHEQHQWIVRALADVDDVGQATEPSVVVSCGFEIVGVGHDVTIIVLHQVDVADETARCQCQKDKRASDGMGFRVFESQQA